MTREQRQMVVTQAPKLEKLRVQVSLYLILGQDHKAARSTPWVWTAVSPCAYVAETTMGTTRASTMRANDAYCEHDDMDDGVNYDGSWAEESQFDADAATI